MVDLSHYTPAHRAELERLLATPAWQEALASGLVEEVRAGRITPGKLRGFIDTVVDQLLAFNAPRVQRLIAAGCADDERLLDELARWPAWLDGRDPMISFLGLNLTAECNFSPKCIYCNQPYIPAAVDLAGWKRIIAEVTGKMEPPSPPAKGEGSGGAAPLPEEGEGSGGAGPYIYITGGEPLVLGEAIWGDGGLVRFATERGAGVNVNTNGVGITPRVALRLIKAGTARLHISLDTPDQALQDYLNGGEHFQQVLAGTYNVQLARDLVGVGYPVIHTNCVLTNRNLDSFPQLFAFLLEKHKQTADRDDPFYNDLFPHVIPVGGAANDWLRPTAEEFRRFYEGVWPEVCALWERYQDSLGVPKEKRGALFGYFSNPFLRVRHTGGLGAYVQASAEGRYGRLALSRHCYVAPTQASFTPDGEQYRCGAHAIRHVEPIGQIAGRGVFESIREGIAGLAALPQEALCDGCALATLYINQSVETKLKEKVVAWRAGTP
jgi:hypothetical protein